MGGAASGKGGVADASLNVVPFIDLLVCLICFLVISATWSALAKIDVDQALPKASKTPPKDKPEKKAEINLAVTSTGYMVNLFNAENADLGIPKKIKTGTWAESATEIPEKVKKLAKFCRGKKSEDGTCDGSIEEYKIYDQPALQKVLVKYMEEGKQGDKIKIMVAMQDKVPYLQLVGALDAVLHACKCADAGTPIDKCPKEKKTCLKNPSVGDLNLLRAKGFSSFE